MASGCEKFERNLLYKGLSQICFNCGEHKDNHVIMISDDEEEAPEVVLLSSDSEVLGSENSYSESEYSGPALPPPPPQQGRPSIFSEAQRQHMIEFGRKFGWSLQPLRSSPIVQHFCDSIGITRKQFRGWIHNHKNKYMYSQPHEQPQEEEEDEEDEQPQEEEDEEERGTEDEEEREEEEEED